MEKQPETEIETFQSIYGDSASSAIAIRTLEFCKAYHTERQKIEAQQVAGKSLEECIEIEGALYKIHDPLGWLMPTSEVLLKAIDRYASACVAEKEKEIERLNKVAEVLHERNSEIYRNQKQRIQELGSSQSAVSDEEINNHLVEYSDSEHEQICFMDGAKWMRTRQSGSQWISVEDRLPDHRDSVLVFVKSLQIEDDGFKQSCLNPAMTAFYVKHDASGEYPIERVTHWMPLPPSPDNK